MPARTGAVENSEPIFLQPTFLPTPGLPNNTRSGKTEDAFENKTAVELSEV